MPKNSECKHYSIIACKKIKGEKTGRALFKLLYKRQGSKKEVQALMNRLNESRGNPGAEFVGFCVERMPALHNVTLAEFFNIKNQTKRDNHETK